LQPANTKTVDKQNSFQHLMTDIRGSSTATENTLRPINRIPDNIASNLKNDYHIFIILGTNIPDTTGDQTTVQVSTSPNVCFCTTWGKRNTRNRR